MNRVAWKRLVVMITLLSTIAPGEINSGAIVLRKVTVPLDETL